MQVPPLPENEKERLKFLEDLEILDTIEEKAYDDLTFIAATICETPISLVSLIDKDRQWFKSRYGLNATQTPRELAFCAHAILQDELFYIPDSLEDERFKDNPLVTGEPFVKFYAGIPLKIKDKYNIGTLCVIDHKKRELSQNQKEALICLGRQVCAQIDLRIKIKELNELDKLKNDFIGMVSHELRTPLTSIYGGLEILNSNVLEKDSSQKEELIKNSYESSKRLIAIVNDILDISKVESNQFKLNLIKLNINEIIQNTINSMSTYLDKFKTKINLDLDNTISLLKLDENRTIQILNNLISNAAKFSKENSIINIKTLKQNDNVLIVIQDFGYGIKEENKKMIFKKFSKFLNSYNEIVQGTGLGLSICKTLVEKQNGQIWFESEENIGTTFFIEFPSIKNEE